MTRASALYLVIVIALVIGVLCSSLIVVAYFYRSEYQKKFRYDRLENNLQSTINIILVNQDTAFVRAQTFDLYGRGTDSASIKQMSWGVYMVATAKSFIQSDTLATTFLIGRGIDSSKWAVLYLKNENRPFSLSGDAMIRGKAYIPNQELNAISINNEVYKGDKRLVIGSRVKSERSLPLPDTLMLKRISRYLDTTAFPLRFPNSINHSFLKPTNVFDLKKNVTKLSKLSLRGNVILRSDTVLVIDSTARLDHAIIFANSIVVERGFKGNCQLFARDSIAIGERCDFRYPSALGVLRINSSNTNRGARIRLGEHSTLNGIIFIYENKQTEFPAQVALSKRDTINGMIYAPEILQVSDGDVLNGCMFTGRFMYSSLGMFYDNYLINTRLDQKGLSPYYLTSGLFPWASKKRKVLQWLERE